MSKEGSMRWIMEHKFVQMAREKLPAQATRRKQANPKNKFTISRGEKSKRMRLRRTNVFFIEFRKKMRCQ